MCNLKSRVSIDNSFPIACLAVVASVTACSNQEPDEMDQQTVTEGMEMYSRMYVDGTLVEEVVDEIKNFGSEESQALFHVNKSHKVYGEEVLPGPDDTNCSFSSLTAEEYEGFIKLFALMQGLAETDQLTDQQKREAFIALFEYLRQYDVDLSLLIYLANNDVEELRCADRLVRSSQSRAGEGSVNDLLLYMVQNNIAPSQMAEESRAMASRQTTYDFNPCRLVVDGKVYDQDQTFRLAHDAKKVSNFDNLFASLININDLNLKHYWGSRTHEATSYEVTYGSQLTPMSHVKFCITTSWDAKCYSQPGYYIDKVEVIIEEIKRTAWMLCDVDVTYRAPSTVSYTDGSYGPYSKYNKVVISYGDKACINFKGQLLFNLEGGNGYQCPLWQKK